MLYKGIIDWTYTNKTWTLYLSFYERFVEKRNLDICIKYEIGKQPTNLFWEYSTLGPRYDFH